MGFTKQRAQSLRMKMRNGEQHLKGTTVIYALQQDCPNKRQSWKDLTAPTGSTPSTEENIRASFSMTNRRFTSLR